MANVMVADRFLLLLKRRRVKIFTRKISTGGFGVIDLTKLQSEKRTFQFFANHLSYPDESPFLEQTVEEAGFLPIHPAYKDVLRYWQSMEHYSLEELQMMYAELFDFQEDATLFMTYVKYEDSKERGQMLARLKVFYEMFGLTTVDGELTDLLPLMCEFIYVAAWTDDERAEQGFNLLFAIIEDGTFHLMKALKKYESPYYYLVKGLRETCKACLIPKGVYSK